MRGPQLLLVGKGQEGREEGKGEHPLSTTPSTTYVAANQPSRKVEAHTTTEVRGGNMMSRNPLSAVTKKRGQQQQLAEGGKGGSGRAKGGLRGTTTTNQPTEVTILQPKDKAEVATDSGAGGGGGSGACVHDSQGKCDVHGQAQKILRPKRVWTKGKNGLFGWRYTRTTYYECRTVTKAEDDTPRPTFVSMKSGSTISKSRNNLIASSNRCMGKGSSGLVNEKSARGDEN